MNMLHLLVAATLSPVVQSIPSSRIVAIADPLIAAWQTCLSAKAATTNVNVPVDHQIDNVLTACSSQKNDLMEALTPIQLINGRNMTPGQLRQAQAELPLSLEKISREHLRKELAVRRAK